VSKFRHIRLRYLLSTLFFVIGVGVQVLVTSNRSALAAGFVNRSLTLDTTNSPSTTANQYTLDFRMPTPITNVSLGSLEILFCTTALRGACTGPTGMGVAGPATVVSASRNGSGITAPVMGTVANAPSDAGTSINSNLASSVSAARSIRVIWASAQTVAANDRITLVLGNITNPSATGTFFARFASYTTAGASTVSITGAQTDDGTVANSIQAQQNVSFKIQETLSFCVGVMPNATVPFYSTAVGAVGATFAGSANLTTACAQSAGTALSLGIAVDSTTTCVTPITTRTSGCNDPTSGVLDDHYAYAMTQTNAASGASIGYRPAAPTNYARATLQQSGVSCSAFGASNRADACINPVNEDQGSAVNVAIAFPATSSLELFGMSVAALNTTGSQTTNLARNSTGANSYGYSGDLAGTCTTGTSSTNCWNWNRTGFGTLASSTAPIDKESIEILFATKPGITTPSGQYDVYIDYYANPTY